MLYIMELTIFTEISDRSTNLHPDISGHCYSNGTFMATERKQVGCKLYTFVSNDSIVSKSTLQVHFGLSIEIRDNTIHIEHTI